MDVAGLDHGTLSGCSWSRTCVRSDKRELIDHQTAMRQVGADGGMHSLLDGGREACRCTPAHLEIVRLEGMASWSQRHRARIRAVQRVDAYKLPTTHTRSAHVRLQGVGSVGR